jgi:hypothetical protein
MGKSSEPPFTRYNGGALGLGSGYQISTLTADSAQFRVSEFVTD